MIKHVCMYLLAAISLLINTAYASSEQSGAFPNTVISNVPIYLLVRELVGAENSKYVSLLNLQSPHSMNLPPSSMRKLLKADYVIYISPKFELFLSKLQAKQIGHYKTLSVLKAVSLEFQAVNAFNFSHQHEHEESKHKHYTDVHRHASIYDSQAFIPNIQLPKNTDFHIWYSPHNLKAMAQWIADWASTIYPDKEGIQKRLLKFLKKMNLKIKQIRRKFKGEELNYIAFHPAYKYFEEFFNLSKQKSYLSSEKINRPSNEQAMRRALANVKLKCVLYDSLSSKKTAQKLFKNQQGKLIYLDPLGSNILKKNGSIILLFDDITEALLKCVK